MRFCCQMAGVHHGRERLLYVADSTNRIWQVSAPDGAQQAQFTAPKPNPYPLAVTDGVLWGLSDGQNFGQKMLYALDASTGSELWHTTTINGQGLNTLVSAAGVIYNAGLTSDGHNSAVTSWDARTGVPGWQRSWKGLPAQGAPLAFGPGTLLIGIRQTLCALNAATGKEQWQLTLDGAISTIEVDGALAYVLTGQGRIYAIQL
jgi:outer membrane protein assembly factor BamB